jgi:hypothetical protein
MLRGLPLLLLFIIGIALGLIYSWAVNPVNLVDAAPASLRADYRADYVLMIAESFHANHDAGLARQELAIFGVQAPATICASALETAIQVGYSQADRSLIQELARAMQADSPIATPAGARP